MMHPNRPQSMRFVLAGLILLVTAGLAAGQGVSPINYNSSLFNRGAFNLQGEGARAMGMGGAFIAVADDATAASWNPAGLDQLTRPEISLVVNRFSRTFHTYQDETLRLEPPSSGESALLRYDDEGSADASNINFFSATYPLEVRAHRFVVQFSYNRLLHFTDSEELWQQQNILSAPPDGPFSTQEYSLLSSADGGIDAYTFSLGTTVARGVRIGASLNYLKVEARDITITDASTAVPPTDGSVYQQFFTQVENFNYEFSGFTFDFGILWKAHEMLQVGAVYHSGFSRDDFDYRYSIKEFAQSSDGSSTTLDFDAAGQGEIHWPNGYGFGAAFKPITPFTVALDYSRSNWSDGRATVTSGNTFDRQYPLLLPGSRQHDIGSLRVGAEYVFTTADRLAIPLRGGFFREDQLQNFFQNEIGEELDTPAYHGFSIGSGLTYKFFEFDIAYVRTVGSEDLLGTYRFEGGDGVSSSAYTKTFGNTYDSRVNRLLVSIIIRF